MNKKFAIAIHGGAGTITRAMMTAEKEEAYTLALKMAIDAGYDVLASQGTSLDAVQAAVSSLENCPLFNAGRGSVFTHDGQHEMDASIMNGENLRAGAVAGISHVRNPVELARLVMEKSEHVMLAADGAMEFARSMGVALEPDTYFHTEQRYTQWQQAKAEGVTQLDHTEGKKFGTVGAVALDVNGNLAAATSTGGMTNKRWGRIGDTPVIGSGTYANNNTCAVSCTGHGEFFLRAVVAYDISCLMEYKGLSLHEASQLVVNKKLVAMGGEGGIVAVDANGNICMSFNSEGMYRAKRNASMLEALVSIYKD